MNREYIKPISKETELASAYIFGMAYEYRGYMLNDKQIAEVFYLITRTNPEIGLTHDLFLGFVEKVLGDKKYD